MVNLEVEAVAIAAIIDKPLDFVLQRRIINTIVNARATLLRQSIVSNKQIPDECIQDVILKVEKVTAFSTYRNNNFKHQRVTSVDVPTPIRTNMDTPFESVSSISGDLNFTHSRIGIVGSQNKGRFTKQVGRYTYNNNRVRIYHNEGAFMGMSEILLRYVLDNPLDYNGTSEENFPLNRDMIFTIKDMIKRGDLNIIPEDREIKVDNDK